jgi:hypothetical protein
MLQLTSAEAASSSTAHADDDDCSDSSNEKTCSPLDKALARTAGKVATKVPKTEYPPDPEMEAHRNAQRSHMLQWAGPKPDPVSVSFNRRTATFVGLAIRQMAKRAYDMEEDSDGDSEGHTANSAASFEAIMSRQTEVCRI